MSWRIGPFTIRASLAQEAGELHMLAKALAKLAGPTIALLVQKLHGELQRRKDVAEVVENPGDRFRGWLDGTKGRVHRPAPAEVDA